MPLNWKYPPTEPPYVNDGCASVSSPTKGRLLLADRNNPQTSPTERDSTIAFAFIAMTYHERLVNLLTQIASGDDDYPEVAQILAEIEADYKSRNR